LAPPLFFLDSWVRQGLMKLVLLQVLVPDAHRSRAPPAGAPPDPPLLPSFLIGAFPSSLSSPPSSTHDEQKPLLDIPFSCAFWRLHELAGAAAPPPSGVSRRRGTIVPLTPRSRAHAPPLHFALACGRVDGRERRPKATPASPRRAPPLSGDTAAASRSHVSWAMRSRVDG
jgi:hypothetical protein